MIGPGVEESQGGLLQGLDLTIPSKFTNTTAYVERGLAPHPDRLTGLPIFDDSLRNDTAHRWRQAVNQSEKWAVLSTDLDQLKSANNVSRVFGDNYIRWGAASLCQMLDKAALSPGAEVRIFRPSHAADEIAVWFFNITEEDIKKIRDVREGLRLERSVPQHNFVFSTSAALILHDDEEIQSELKTIKESPESHFFGGLSSFQRTLEAADARTHGEKILKDLKRLPVEELMKSSNLINLIHVMRRDLGDQRNSGEVIELLGKIVSIKAVGSLAKRLKPETYAEVVKELGLDPSELKPSSTIEEVLALFHDLFGKSE